MSYETDLENRCEMVETKLTKMYSLLEHIIKFNMTTCKKLEETVQFLYETAIEDTPTEAAEAKDNIMRYITNRQFDMVIIIDKETKDLEQ